MPASVGGDSLALEGAVRAGRAGGDCLRLRRRRIARWRSFRCDRRVRRNFPEWRCPRAGRCAAALVAEAGVAASISRARGGAPAPAPTCRGGAGIPARIRERAAGVEKIMIDFVHPTGNQNVRQVLGALEARGLLGTFHTSLGFPSGTWTQNLPGSLRAECVRRTYQLPAAKMHTRPAREFVRDRKSVV